MRSQVTASTPRALLAGIAFATLGHAPVSSLELTPQELATPTQERSDDHTARELKRILHLKNGQALRAKTRVTDGQWEYRSDRTWKAIPMSLVGRVTLERDVLRELKSRSKAVDDTDLDGRVALARWMVDEGLLEESLNELSRVLETSAHHPRALSLLAERPFVAVPSLSVAEEERQDAMVALFDWAIAMPRAGQELALLEFARYKDKEGFREDVAKALGSHSIHRRAFAARLLGRLFPGQDVKRLLAHAVLDAAQDVRGAAADALAAAEEPALIVPVVRALGSKHSRVRQQAAEALGNMGYGVAVEPLMSHLAALSAAQAGSGTRAPHSHVFFGRQFAYVQDFDVEVAQFQSIADPQINVLIEGSVQDSAVQASSETVSVVERSTVRGALSQLTGANPGRNSRAWLEWWEEHEGDWTNLGGPEPTDG